MDIHYAHRAQWDGPPLPETATIYNAPRPLYGDVTWVGKFRRGTFYAAVFSGLGADALHKRNKELDAATITLVDNAAVERLVLTQLAVAGYSMDDYEEIGMSMAEVARERGLPWVEEENDDS